MLAMHSDVLSSVVSAVSLSTRISTIISARKHPPHTHTKQGEVWSYSYYIQLWILGHKQLLLQFNIKDFCLDSRMLKTQCKAVNDLWFWKDICKEHVHRNIYMYYR